LRSEVLTASLARLRVRELVEQREGRWRASPLGFNFLNDVVSEFLAPQR
jgi:coproporphyrinogen III oxidase-like Fe-S oxidoreductase